MLAQGNDLLGHLNRTEPLLMFIVRPGLFILSQVNMSAVKKGLLRENVFWDAFEKHFYAILL